MYPLSVRDVAKHARLAARGLARAAEFWQYARQFCIRGSKRRAQSRLLPVRMTQCAGSTSTVVWRRAAVFPCDRSISLPQRDHTRYHSEHTLLCDVNEVNSSTEREGARKRTRKRHRLLCTSRTLTADRQSHFPRLTAGLCFSRIGACVFCFAKCRSLTA